MPVIKRLQNLFFADDRRITFICADAKDYLLSQPKNSFDLIFADVWPGKYELLEETLTILKPGGMYIIDDMLPQPNWPDGHDENVSGLIAYLEELPGIRLTRLNWSTGIIIVSKIS